MEEVMNTENTVITYTDYRQYKHELDTELEKSAESFIRIGYLLKVARDTGILKESGYANVNEFAQKEYGLDKTQVSRFMRINDRFSQDGYAEVLKEEYKGFGYAKLAIMLQLPDSLNEELSPEYSKAEIQALKEECDEERKISNLEVLMEQKDEVQQSMDDLLQQVTYQLGKEDSELYAALWESMITKKESGKQFIEHLAPSGTKTYSVRIPGKGRMMLIIKEGDEKVKIINVREPEDKRSYEKRELEEAFRKIFTDGDARASWESIYGETFPEKKEEVAPVQPEQRKESKVTKAKTAEKPRDKKRNVTPEKNSPATAAEQKEIKLHDIAEDVPEPPATEHQEETQPAAAESQEAQQAAVPGPQEAQRAAVIEPEEEQQCEGQMEISDFPKYMPEPDEGAELRLLQRAHELVKMSLLASIEMWKETGMPLESIRNNKERVKELVEIFEKLEELANV